ncbi:MAG: hypothetical protein JWL75_131 [Parcubacteria group bacterium]|nr:hypothetical protein [Parcubacteria group bacterium]
MNSIQKRYTRSSFPVLVYCGTNRVTNPLIRDADAWEEFNERTVSSYLAEGTQTFVSSVKDFTKPHTAYDSVRAKELRFMLEALIEVKEVFAAEELPVLERED